MKTLSLTLVLCVTALLLLGSVALYSASMRQPEPTRLYAHLGWIALGLAVGALVAVTPYAWLRRWHAPYVLLGIAVVLLALVFVPGIGIRTNGACRWLRFGQPSEFAKLALIVALAHYIATRPGRMHERNAGFLYPGILAGAVGLLIFLEPDWGTAALMAAVTLAMLLVGGAHGFYLTSAIIIGGEAFFILLLRNQLRLLRVISFLDPERYRDGPAWQGWHSLLSLGVGGWFGTFWGEGTHKFGFVPEQETDFILSLIGEELGLFGTSLVILFFCLIVFCGARIAWRTNDPFAQLLAVGITLLIGFQAFINIGVVTSSLPNKGLALPFVSYGGSNLVCMLTAVGLLINVARHAPLAETAPAGKGIFTAASLKIGGPIGSLLDDPSRRTRQGFGRQLHAWLRRRRNARFPTLPRHNYQRPPRPRETGPAEMRGAGDRDTPTLREHRMRAVTRELNENP